MLVFCFATRYYDLRISHTHTCEADLLVIRQEVIGGNDVLIELLDDSIPVHVSMTGMASPSPAQVSAC